MMMSNCWHAGPSRGQPTRYRPAVGLAFIAGTWNKNDHGLQRLAPESATRQGTRLRSPPSLLSIRIHADKESHPALLPIGRFTMTPTLFLLSPANSTTWMICALCPNHPRCYSDHEER